MIPSTILSTPSRPLQYNKAIAESDLVRGVRATCWDLATFADNTGKAWPSVKRLAKATRAVRARGFHARRHGRIEGLPVRGTALQ